MAEDIEIKDIEEALRTEDSPVQLASFLTRLAAIHSYRIEQLKKIQLVKPQRWLELQANFASINTETGEVRPSNMKPLSDKKTEMTWATTEDGQKEIALTMEIKRINLMTSAIRTRLFTTREEMKNLKTY